MILKGMLQKEMAHELGISAKTVEKYVQALYYKFGVSSRVVLVRVLLRTNFISIQKFLDCTDGENKVHERPQRYERVTRLTPQP